MEGALESLTEKIRSLPHKRSFYRFVAVIVESSRLPTEKQEKGGNYETYEFTADSKAKIRKSVDALVQLFNDTHPLDMTATLQEVLEEVSEIWTQDARAHERHALLPK